MRKNLRNNLTHDSGGQLRVSSRELRGLKSDVNKISVWVVFIVLALASCTGRETSHEHDVYTCPMHPTVESDRPGACPVCGMDLVRKARPGEEVEITEDLSKLIRSTNETVISSIKTIKGLYKPMPVTISAQGVVTYDTRNINTIAARIGGRLERVYLKYNQQVVSKGQKIAEIYSPELITAQREFLFLLKNDAENLALVDAAKRKLRLLGLSEAQIDQLEQRKEVGNTVSIYSPYSGYIVSESANINNNSTDIRQGQNSSTKMSGGMSSPSNTMSSVPENNRAESIVIEGDYVTAGQTLFTIVNTNALRVELNIPGTYANVIKKGTKINLDFGNGKSDIGTVDFIQPFFTEGQNFIKVRAYIKGDKDLHIGQLVNASIDTGTTEALWVPGEAVLDLGDQQIVFLKDRGVFKPKQVTTGISSDNMIEIKTGLASSDEIATNAQFLMDSESFVKTTR